MKIHLTVISVLCFLISAQTRAQICGCTDSLAINYNPAATLNDGSCIYNSASIAPLSSVTLPGVVSETSGLAAWNGCLWTHNDNSDTRLYALDTASGAIIDTVQLNNVVNTDWEEISQDGDYLYIGDFGNNLNGNRTDLKILRISKSSIFTNDPIIDTINFAYSDQLDFTPAGANNTDFDCEAMVVSADSIYLFTKQWISKGTMVYSLPKIPGTYSAYPVSSFDIGGLITGATYLENKKVAMLCGYSTLLQPFTWLLYDFSGHRFFSGNKRKISVSLPFHQTEAITTCDGLNVYMTNEAFSQPPVINNPQQLHIFDFSAYLSQYLNNLIMNLEIPAGEEEVFLYPNPAAGFVCLRFDDSLSDKKFSLLNSTGSAVLFGTLKGNSAIIDLTSIRSGIYLLKIEESNRRAVKLIRR